MTEETYTVNIEENKRLASAFIGFAFIALAVLLWLWITKWCPPILSWLFLLPFLLVFTIGTILSIISAYQNIGSIKKSKTYKYYISVITSLISIMASLMLVLQFLK